MLGWYPLLTRSLVEALHGCYLRNGSARWCPLRYHTWRSVAPVESRNLDSEQIDSRLRTDRLRVNEFSTAAVVAGGSEWQDGCIPSLVSLGSFLCALIQLTGPSSLPQVHAETSHPRGCFWMASMARLVVVHQEVVRLKYEQEYDEVTKTDFLTVIGTLAARCFGPFVNPCMIFEGSEKVKAGRAGAGRIGKASCKPLPRSLSSCSSYYYSVPLVPMYPSNDAAWKVHPLSFVDS